MNRNRQRDPRQDGGTGTAGTRRRLARRVLACAGVAVMAGAFVLPLLDRLFPFPEELLDRHPAAVELTDREGCPIRLRLGEGDFDARPWYRHEEGDWIALAIVAVEDRRFWQHTGMDYRALARACVQNLRARRVVSGASTLSMQLIRLMEPRPRTLWSKVVESFRARQLERLLGKEHILEQYLNRAPFGSNIVGIQAASRRYYGKDPRDLSLPEAALLAGLPQSPERLRPDRHPARAAGRREQVLRGMERAGMITAAARERAADFAVAVRSPVYPFRYPHFAGYALGALPPDAEGSLRATVDPFCQETARVALRRTLATHAGGERLGGAVVILDVRTGSVRAMVGSPDFFDAARAGQVNGALAARSPGSALKPFVYLLALERGELTPARVLADVPQSYGSQDPVNFDGVFTGLVSARNALALSLNMPALHVAAEVGAESLHRALRDLGLDTVAAAPAHYGLGLALGNAEVRLLDLCTAYACLARGGTLLPVRVFEEGPLAEPRPLFSAEAVWLVNEMLSGEDRPLAGGGHQGQVRTPRLAWKTGTSSGHRDAWVVAYNPEYVVGVWLGRPDGRSTSGLVGVQSAAPVARDIFRALYPRGDGPWYARPDGVTGRMVCARSGQPAGRYCPAEVHDFHIPGVTRHEICTVHRHPPDPSGAVAETWPPEIAAFLARSRQPAAPEAGDSAAAGPLRITSPSPNSVWRRPERGTAALALEARGAVPGEMLYWFADDTFLGRARSDERFWWEPQPGQHRLVASDTRGSSAFVFLRVE